jgi:hypothetical protein
MISIDAPACAFTPNSALASGRRMSPMNLAVQHDGDHRRAEKGQSPNLALRHLHKQFAPADVPGRALTQVNVSARQR